MIDADRHYLRPATEVSNDLEVSVPRQVMQYRRSRLWAEAWKRTIWTAACKRSRHWGSGAIVFAAM